MDAESAAWLSRLGAEGTEGSAVERELHAKLVRLALAEVRRRAASTPVAETAVYLRGPGTVVRYRNCSAMLMAISRIRGMNCVDLGGLTALDPRQDG